MLRIFILHTITKLLFLQLKYDYQKGQGKEREVNGLDF